MAAGFGAGILSAWGVGGGTLQLLVMTIIMGVPQQQAAADGAAGAAGPQENPDGTVSGDYTVVDDDKK